MKRPRNAPSFADIASQIKPELKDAMFLASRTAVTSTVKGRYLHWDELLHSPPPADQL